MSKHTVTVTWRRHGSAFTDRKYSRAHEWSFDGGKVIPASSSPHVVPTPFSDAAGVDPEEAFVAAVSSCHMLWFLDFAARAGYIVDSYIDRAEGHMGQRPDAKQWIARVLLLPEVHFTGAKAPDEAAVHALHEAAHESCFIANSVKTDILVRGSWTMEPLC
jgi:organic hydroperoxide reductase OsmC/OhrA